MLSIHLDFLNMFYMVGLANLSLKKNKKQKLCLCSSIVLHSEHRKLWVFVPTEQQVFNTMDGNTNSQL